MGDNKIRIPVNKAAMLQPGQVPVIKLSVEAYNTLAKIVGDSSLSMKEVASTIIIQSVEKGLIEYDREGDE